MRRIPPGYGARENLAMARTQVRLGLVVEGGVSLAVWMSGVTHEVDLLRRAGSPGREPLPADGETALRRWRDLCDELDVDVVVDVLAGTSAGGLNVAFLASAIAADQPLPALKEVWSKAAALERGKLLREASTGPLPSLLDGDFFTGQIRSVLAGLHAGSAGPSPYPVTLLTTATALGEQMAVWQDSAGQRFDVADHRRVYRFRNDPTEVRFVPPGGDLPRDVFELFVPHDPGHLGAQTVEEVTRAARATAGFPGAFEPVSEHDDRVDLRRYQIRGGSTDEAALVDGGVLDNTPFEPLIDEIGRRPVDGSWRRVVGYVVANDGLMNSKVLMRDAPARLAREWFPVLSSALRMSSETAFRNGVEALAQLSLEAERLVMGPEILFGRLLAGPLLGEGFDVLYGLYRQNRVEAGILNAYLTRTGIDTGAGIDTARQVCVPPLSGIRPADGPLWVPPLSFPAAVEAPEWRWGTAVADRCVRLLTQHLHTWSTSQRQAAGAEEASTVEVGHALGELSRVRGAVTALRDFINKRVIEAPDEDPRTLLDALNGATAEAAGPAVLHALMRHAAHHYAQARTDLPVEALDIMRAMLAVEVMTQAVAGRLPLQRPARFDLVRMGPDVDSPGIQPPPLAGEDQPRPFGDWKLYGTQLDHFGAFGRPEWRAHDHLWGRLDGAAHLVRVLSRDTDSPLRDENLAQAAIAAAQQAVLDEEQTDRAAVQAQLVQVSNMDTKSTLDAFRDSSAGRQAAEDIVADALRMLEVRAPGTPSAVPATGGWVSAVLALKMSTGPGLRIVHRMVRVITMPWPRPRFWHWVRGSGR
jgi:predicted acylesterase/phospholipase RssA